MTGSAQSGWWCPALWISVFTCLPHLTPMQSGWWCPAFRVSFLTGSLHLSPAFQMSLFTCLPAYVSSSVASGVRLSVSLRLSPSLAVSLSLCLSLSLYLFLFLKQFIVRVLRSVYWWWCLALLMSLFTCSQQQKSVGFQSLEARGWCPDFSLLGDRDAAGFRELWNLVSHLSPTCVPLVCHLSATCLPLVCHLSATCLSLVFHLSSTCLHWSPACLPLVSHKITQNTNFVDVRRVLLQEKTIWRHAR